jgi:hypothetical protein
MSTQDFGLSFTSQVVLDWNDLSEGQISAPSTVFVDISALEGISAPTTIFIDIAALENISAPTTMSASGICIAPSTMRGPLLSRLGPPGRNSVIVCDN